MISYISGTLTEIESGFIVVEAGGIGYGINVPVTMPARLPGIGSSVKVYTYFHVTDDSMKLFGFYSEDERALFKMLISVSGVGPKVGIAILSTLTPDEIRLAILSDDEKALARAQGLGAKTAKKIILELKDKFAKDIEGGSSVTSNGGAFSSNREDAIAAMVALGISSSDAFSAITKIGDVSEMTTEEILALALKKLV